MKPILAAAVISISALGFVGCASTHEEGVRSNMLSQWTTVAADTQTTTEAAEAVLSDEGLKNVTSKSTMQDGEAHGKLSDGTDVHVSVAKVKDVGSQVSVKVGTIGDRAMGAELAKKIKVKAEGM